ncbi:promotilin [Notamacropus eugenii]|uniref:promotilin n=1 Tax=Notamacropus eugenii TaxID=9315 RepID=UPI003B680FC7
MRCLHTSQRIKDKNQNLHSLFSRMVSRKIVATMLVIYIATMLAAQTEGFVPLFTYSDVQRMQEKERNRGQKKSLSVQQRSEEGDPLALVDFKKEKENEMVKLTAPVEIGIRMNSRQLEKYRGVLEELLTEVLLSTQNVN